jgi:hypothetical protein
MAGAGQGMCELTARHGRGTAWARHDMCESALKIELDGESDVDVGIKFRVKMICR